MVCLVAGVLASLAAPGCRPRTAGSWDWVGDLSRPDSSRLELRAGSGPVLLVFLSTWSVPCQPLLEEVVSLQDRAQVVPILVDGSPAVAAEMCPGLDMVVPTSERVTERFGIDALPTTVIIDRNGAVVDRFVGYSPLVCVRIRDRFESLSGRQAAEATREE